MLWQNPDHANDDVDMAIFPTTTTSEAATLVHPQEALHRCNIIMSSDGEKL